MFPYYGGKKRIVSQYPAPEYDTIVEPFAGSAAYALHHATPSTRVILVEKNPEIANVWRYLKRASPAEILALPLPRPKERLDSRKYAHLTPVQRKLISLFTAPNNKPHTNNFVVSEWSKWNERERARLAERSKRVRKWTILTDTYESLSNKNATWFFDPPYETTISESQESSVGAGYGPNFGVASIDFRHLASFVRSRCGQVIAADRATARWLPFKKLVGTTNQRSGQYNEGIFTRTRHCGRRRSRSRSRTRHSS